MIKVFATDMDGTLLTSDKRLPPMLGEVVKMLHERGIMFLPVSGRIRPSLDFKFSVIDSRLPYVSDNGGAVYDEEGNSLYSASLSAQEAEPIIRLAEEVDFLDNCLCGSKHAYVLKTSPKEVRDFLHNFFGQDTVIDVDDLREVFNIDNILKIAIGTGSDGSREDEGVEIVKPHIGEGLDYTLSGDGWIDFARKGVTKANALKIFMDHYGVAMDEIVVFGDYPNDADMLSMVPDSVCVSNAHPDIKKIAKTTLEFSNNEYGVIREIDRRIGLGIDWEKYEI